MRSPLDVVGVEQRRGGPPVKNQRQLPREIEVVTQAGAHALPRERRHDLSGIAHDQQSAPPPVLSEERPCAERSLLWWHPGRQQLGTLEHLEVRVMLDPSLAIAAAALTFLISAREP